ncbi:hypothetical protein BH20ACT4_BH20ACT4_14230 [soil metagenome]
MTPISIDTAYQLVRQRQRELEHTATLARAARQARSPRRWNVLALLRRPAPSSSTSVSRQTTAAVVCRDTEAGRAA